MMSLVFFVISCLILLTDASYSNDDVSQYMEDSVNGFKLEIHKASQQRKRRVKRTVEIHDFSPTEVNTEPAFESQIYNITPWQSLPTTHPVEIEPFKIRDVQYVAVVNYKNLQNEFQTTSAVYVMNSTTKFDLLQEFATSGGIDFEFADLGSEKYAIFLDHVGQNWYNENTYEKWFQLQQFLPSESLEKPFKYRTKVRALGAKRVKVFTKDLRNYFVTANSFYEAGNKYHVKSTMHVQGPFGYELVESFETSGAQDVEVIMIDGVRYILFVNHQDNSGKVDIYSVVYRERINKQVARNGKSFELYQQIATHGARDFEYFAFEGGHYLVVANEYTQITAFDSILGHYITIKDYNIDSIIYWWTGTMWVEWQKIPTHGAVKWSFFKSAYGDPMLVVANSKTQATIYTYDPLRGLFKPTDVQGLSPFPDQQNIVPDVRSVMAFQSGNETFLAVANYNKTTRSGYNIFKLSFLKKPVPKLDPSVPEIISALLMRMKTELEAIKNSLSTVLLEVTNNVMTKSTDQNITANVMFHNVTIRDTHVTNNTFYRHNVTVNPVELSAKQAVILKDLLARQEAKILELQTKLNDAVRINEPAIIHGEKTFTKDITVTDTLTTNVTTVNGLVDGTNLTHLTEKSWSKSQDQILNGHYTIINNVLVTENLTANGLLNGIPVDTLLTTNTQQTVSGKKEFNDNLHLLGSVTLTNFTLNGYNVPDDFITRDGDQTIQGNKSFTDVVFDHNLVVNGLVAGMNLSEFNRNKMTLSTNQYVSNDITFESGFTIDSDLTTYGLIDGINITALQQDVLMQGKTQVITGPKTFTNVTIKSSLEADNINGYHLSDAVTTNTLQTITANMVFDHNFNVKENMVSGSTIDGVDLSMHAVTISGNQTIGGYKRMSTPVTNFHGDAIISGLVDGVDLNSWRQNAVRIDTLNVIGGNKTFSGGVTIVNNLETNHINRINIVTLKDNLVSTVSNESLETSFIFENVVVKKDLQLFGKVNNYSIPDDFVTLNTVQTIRGVKVFKNKTIVTGKLQSDVHINGENFTQFYENVVKNGTNETIFGDVTFTDDVYLGNVEVIGKVNSLSIPDDIVTINTFQNVSGKLTFTEDTVFQDIVNTYIVHVNETVNGIDVYNLEQTVIHKDRNQTINGSIFFAAGIDCKMNLSVAGLINGVNLTELMYTTVRITRDQQVSGQKNFESDVKFENTIQSPGTINGANLTELNNNIMKTSGTQTVQSNVFFKKDVLVKTNINLANNSLVNGINLKSYVQNAIKKDKQSVIDGSITYNKLNVHNLNAKIVDHVNITNILLTKTNQSVTGWIHFNNLQVENMIVNGLVNKLNIDELYRNAVRKNTAQNITARYNFKNLHVQGDVNVAGNINGINLQRLYESAVHLDTDQVINGHKLFENVSFENVNFKGLLNGINMTLLAEDTLTKTGNQTVCWKKTFVNEITINSHVEVGNIYTSGLINNVDLTELSRNAVRLNEHQVLNGTYRFQSGLEVGILNLNGLLNGVDMNTDLVKTYGDHNVSGLKQFRKLNVQGDLNVRELVDGVNIEDLESNRVTLTTNQSIYGHKTIQNVVMKNDLSFADNATLNGIDISSNLVLTVAAGIIHGNKGFKKVLVTNDVNTTTGIVNDVNLRSLNENALKLTGGHQVVSSDQYFVKSLAIIGDMTVDGLINGMKVSNVGNYTDGVSDSIKNELLALSSAASSLCERTTKLVPVSATEKIVTGIQKIHVKSFSTNDLGDIHSTIINDTVFVSIARSSGSMCGPAYILKCTKEMQCSVLQTIQTNAPKIEFFQYSGYPALYVSHWKSGTNESSTCKQDPEIFTYSSSSQQYTPYQTLNVGLMESAESAPVLNSTTIVSNYLGKMYGQYKKSHSIGGGSNQQNLYTKNFEEDMKNYLVVGGTEGESDFVEILLINGTTMGTLKKQQRIKTNNGKHVSVGKLRNGKMIIAASSISNGGHTKLYIRDEIDGQFKFYQKLAITGTSIKFKNIGKTSFLSYANPAKGFGVCSWQGASGYTGCKSLEFTDTKSVETIITTSGAYTLAGTDDRLLIFKTIFEGNDEIYSNDIC